MGNCAGKSKPIKNYQNNGNNFMSDSQKLLQKEKIQQQQNDSDKKKPKDVDQTDPNIKNNNNNNFNQETQVVQDATKDQSKDQSRKSKEIIQHQQQQQAQITSPKQLQQQNQKQGSQQDIKQEDQQQTNGENDKQNNNKTKNEQTDNKNEQNTEKKQFNMPLKEESDQNSIRDNSKTFFDKQILKQEQVKLNENADQYFSEEEIKYYEQKYKDEKIQIESHKNNKIRWKEGEFLGSGSFGKVIMGMNLDTGELMAVKQIDRRDIPCFTDEQKKDMLEALELEIDLLKNLQHKNIVEYMGTTKSKETLNIFLEYVAQGSISFLIEKYGKFNEVLTRNYMQKILEGLEYLHSHKVVHRDLKGANVLVDNQGVCKLADFGSSKRLYNKPNDGQLEQIKGTVNWMAPEAIKQQECSRFSDIWSIGCTLLEMLTGKIPYHQFSNVITAMYQIGKGTILPEIPEELSPEAKDFLNLCFKIEPKERPNVCKLLKHPFIVNVGQKPRASGFLSEMGNNAHRASGKNLNLKVEENNLNPNSENLISPNCSMGGKNILFSIRDLGNPDEQGKRKSKRVKTKQFQQFQQQQIQQQQQQQQDNLATPGGKKERSPLRNNTVNNQYILYQRKSQQIKQQKLLGQGGGGQIDGDLNGNNNNKKAGSNKNIEAKSLNNQKQKEQSNTSLASRNSEENDLKYLQQSKVKGGIDIQQNQDNKNKLVKQRSRSIEEAQIKNNDNNNKQDEIIQNNQNEGDQLHINRQSSIENQSYQLKITNLSQTQIDQDMGIKNSEQQCNNTIKEQNSQPSQSNSPKQINNINQNNNSDQIKEQQNQQQNNKKQQQQQPQNNKIIDFNDDDDDEDEEDCPDIEEEQNGSGMGLQNNNNSNLNNNNMGSGLVNGGSDLQRTIPSMEQVYQNVFNANK